MISRHVGDYHLVRGRHTEQVGVKHEMIRVLVVAIVVDVIADVVQERRVRQDATVVGAEPESLAERVEQLERQRPHGQRVLFLVVAALAQLTHRSLPRLARIRHDEVEVPGDAARSEDDERHAARGERRKYRLGRSLSEDVWCRRAIVRYAVVARRAVVREDCCAVG